MPSKQQFKVEMNLDETTEVLREGYCLWIGAGVTTKIASSPSKAPGWSDLTKAMEDEVLKKNPSFKRKTGSYPSRLQACYEVLGPEEFARLLRNKYYTQLCADLLKEADQWASQYDKNPPSALLRLQQVAALGQFANPVVSFNIEPLS